MGTITWKDEDEVDDVPIGPISLIDEEGLHELMWGTKAEARKIANEDFHGFEEV